MPPRTRVPSFDLDHRRVRAPYVRLAGFDEGPKGDVVTKWDLRLCQPNAGEIPTGPLHTIEHLLAGYLRDALEEAPVKLLDASPMGCRTGFYLVVMGEPEATSMLDACSQALADIAAHEGPIPGCSPERCGNWRDHSLPGAKAWAAEILERDLIVQETILLEE